MYELYIMNRIDDSKIINYNDDDPRYGFTIKDSDEYNESIYPIGLKRDCTDKCIFMQAIKDKYPLVTRCWGERYENCIDIYTMHDLYCKRCKEKVYNPDSPTFDDNPTISRNTRSSISNDKNILRNFTPKNINNNTFYDKSWINKYDINTESIENFNHTDTSPDTLIMIYLFISIIIVIMVYKFVNLIT